MFPDPGSHQGSDKQIAIMGLADLAASRRAVMDRRFEDLSPNERANVIAADRFIAEGLASALGQQESYQALTAVSSDHHPRRHR